MPIYATCPDCDWQIEADDRADAYGASRNHWDAAHAPDWCHFCEPTGPAYKRRDHDECIELALTEERADRIDVKQIDPGEVTL